MSTLFAPDTLSKRQMKLVQALNEAGLDGMAFNPGPSLTYLTGLHFHLMERPVVLLFTTQSPPVLALPELERGKAEGLPYDLQAISYGEDPETWPAAFERLASAAGLQAARVGVESRRMRVLELRLLQGAMPQVEFAPAEETVATLRMRKDQAEVAAMRQAVRIAQEAMQAAIPSFKAGMTELEVAAEVTMQLLRHGSRPELPFFPIVAAGPNSANPHATGSDRKLASGDLLIIDWGANVEGYFSDLTRTFAVGQLDEELARVHQAVQQANAAGRARVAPGVTCGQVDQAARQVIEAAGYGDYFIHRTGHGLGMEEHEEPNVRAGNDMPLEPGMTFTVEPGVYLSGRGGVRVEDNVLVTAEGMESLSDLERDLITIG